VRFYVIYSIDVPEDSRVSDFYPKNWRKFEITEDDGQYKYGYLEGDWEKGHHSKLVGDLSKPEFMEFVRSTGLQPEDCETMGSITEFGHLPAISFIADMSYGAILDAYVTPYIEGRTGSEEDWQRVKRAIMNLFR
jgi:hypothetical protein